MKGIRIFLFAIIFLVVTFNVDGRIVPLEEARSIARNLYFERVQSFRSIAPEQVKISEEFTVSMAGEPVYYVFNIGIEEGFVIISADDRVFPVLAYSFSGRYNTDDHNPAFQSWMQIYEEQILDCRGKELFRYAEIEEAWEKYSRDDFSPAKNIQTVGPICKTTWNQGKYYNDSCPSNSLTGCVATAMAQVMKAFNWPPKGKGSYSYSHSYYGLQSANFGNTTYKWNEMPNVVTSPNPAVAQLMYHCGVSVDMSYSPGGSGASMYSAKDAFIFYFRYSPFIRLEQKNSFTDIYWKILIRAQHMNDRPVMYSGPGHAFICDGFQYPDHFHFNWGWGGSYDGYYYMTSLRPGSHNYTNGQDAIVDCYPDSTKAIEGAGEGAKRISDNDEIQIMPNPVTDGALTLAMINDYTGDVVVTITNVAGQVFDRFIISKESEWSKTELNLGYLTNGFYMMHLEAGQETYRKKFLVSR